MTQSTEKKRALEVDIMQAIEMAVRCGAIRPDQRCDKVFEITRIELLRLVNAARRAPVVPQGWKITEEMHAAAVKVLHRAPGVDGLPQRMVDAMLAAAPQPPEAATSGAAPEVSTAAPDTACNPSMQPELATKAASVQLPEYGIDTANHAGIRVRGYTEQQVRELLEQKAARIAELEKDAARYRVIRDAPYSDSWGDLYAMTFQKYGDMPLKGGELDFWADDAISRYAAMKGDQSTQQEDT